MNAAHAIRRLEAAGFTHQQATGVVEVVQGEVIDKVATREYVGEQIDRLTFRMNGFLAALLVAVLGLCGILIRKV